MYVALRPLKVQLADGSCVVRMPGDAVPEAEHWKYVYKHIDNGRIRLADKPLPVSVKKASVGLLKNSYEKPSAKKEPVKELFECTVCGKGLPSLAGMRRHRSIVHKVNK